MKKAERLKQVEILCKQKKSQKEMAQILQVSIATISNDIRKLKAEKNIQYTTVAQKRHQDTQKEVQALWEKGRTREEIAEELEKSFNNVGSYLREIADYTIEIEQQKEERKETIRTMYQAGKSQKEIAKALGVTYPRANILIRRMCEEEGIEYQSDNQRKKKMYTAKVKGLLKAGKSTEEIMQAIGLRESATHKYIVAAREEIETEKRKTYMQACRIDLQNGTLKEEALQHMKEIIIITHDYRDMITYVKACIQWTRFEDAKKILIEHRNSKRFSAEQKQKIKRLIEYLEKIQIRQQNVTHKKGINRVKSMGNNLDQNPKGIQKDSTKDGQR